MEGERVAVTELSKTFLRKESESYFGDFFIRNGLLETAYSELKDLLLKDSPNEAINSYTKKSFGLEAGEADSAIWKFGKPMMAASERIFSDLFSKYSIP